METWEIGERWRFGAWQAVGLGLVAGAVETSVHAASPVPWSIPRLCALGVGALLVDALVAGALGMLCGPVHTLRRGAPGYRNVALQLALVAAALLGLGLGPWAWSRWSAGQQPVALAFLALVGVTAYVVQLNARYWLARKELGKGASVSWLAVASALSSLVVGLAVLLGALVPRGASFALAGDPNVLVVTVDGLSQADVPSMPTLAALGQEGATFEAAIVPSTSAVANLGTVWTALHPLRHRAVDDLRALPLGLLTLPERFSSEGFTTAAFLSTARASGVGLDQGFAIFDDELGALPLTRLAAVRTLLGPGAVRRGAGSTAAAAGGWMDENRSRPFLAWVQLDLAEGSEVVDAALAALLNSVARAELAERTLVVVASTGGRDPEGRALGLSDARVRVPLVLRAPGRPGARAVAPQVRLADVGVTALAWAALGRPDEVEGLDLLGFLDGSRDASVWTAIVGREGAQWRVGVRQDRVKVVFAAEGEEAVLYDLASDPEERTDLSAGQATAVDAARRQLGSDLAALGRVLQDADLGAARRRVLQALGDPP